MLAQVVVLPLVEYATVDVALLNTIKGGMGADGYYGTFENRFRRTRSARRFRIRNTAKCAMVFRIARSGRVYFQKSRFQIQMDFLCGRKHLAYAFIPTIVFLLRGRGQE